MKYGTDLIITIPTLNRAHRQIAYAKMPDWVQPQVRFFTNFGQSETLKDYVPEDQIVELGDNDGGIAVVRQRMMEWCRQHCHERIWMLDDHGQFYYREEGQIKLTKLVRENDYQWFQMLETIHNFLDDYPWVGLSERAGNHLVPENYKTATRSHSVYGLNLPWMEKLNVRFDAMYLLDPRVKTVEDYQAVLTMLVQGTPNAVLYNFANQFDHGKQGGCNTYRDNAHRKICAEALQDLYPDFVKAWKRPCKVQTMDGAGDWRWDVKIQWKKALDAGLKASGLDSLL